MKFWDTSALVPLVLSEDSSRSMRQLMMADVNTVVSFISLIELQSAIARRTGNDEPEVKQAAAQFVSVLQAGWTVPDGYAEILSHARQLASVYALRTGDAIQLASAIAICGGSPRIPFVTLDAELASAARAEGFPILP